MRGRLTDLMSRVMADRTQPDEEAAAGWAEFPGAADSIAVCRHFAAGLLRDCPRADDLVLAVSELATNAVRWSASGEAGGTFRVRVRRVACWARVEVVDAGPASVPPGPGNGYGLLIVAEVTDRSGASPAPDGRRTAWAECTWAETDLPQAQVHDRDR
jgi:serine/threonine-protein kinase RsbW